MANQRTSRAGHNKTVSKGAPVSKTKKDAKRVSSRDAERSKRKLLTAARKEFSEKGFSGARVDRIVKSAGVNKQLLYYYFGDKETLFFEVIEATYMELREAEKELDLKDMDPMQAIESLIDFNFDYVSRNPDFVALLRDENIHLAQHIKKSEKIRDLHFEFQGLLKDILDRGAAAGVFRQNIDPVEFYISVASLCYFYFSNCHTLSVIFDRNLTGPAEIAARRQHILDMVMAYVSR